MGPKVFLSLSYVDDDFVDAVFRRLPSGLAFFYKKSFGNSESLISEMEQGVAESKIFVLFASRQAIESGAVQFEISKAHQKLIGDSRYRILVYPTSSKVSVGDLPDWLKAFWMPKAGYSSADIARHITQLIIEEYREEIFGGQQVVGRGKALDELSALYAVNLAGNRASPRAIVLNGFRGIGRRTFAKYYCRTALSYIGNAAYGPTLALPDQADIADLYLELLVEINEDKTREEFLANMKAFHDLDGNQQVQEVTRKLSHFHGLGQVPIMVSASGFFEDDGSAKSWVSGLFSKLPQDTLTIFVSNRMFPPEIVSGTGAVVQYRVPELSASDIRTLMVLTAKALNIPEFEVSEDIVNAIGGHPDVARQAVLVAKVHGPEFFERNPRVLFDIQQKVMSESISDEVLSSAAIDFLALLSWVPSLPGRLLWEVMETLGYSEEDFSAAVEDAVLACLVVPVGRNYHISPAIRMMFRRQYPASERSIRSFSETLRREWEESEAEGDFRADLFEAFVFMHTLAGTAMPQDLRGLLTPGMLHEVVRLTYNQGKDKYDPGTLRKAISWGNVAENMRMSPATLEEILSIVARSQIRVRDYTGAEQTIAKMKAKGFRSVAFLTGHSLRRQGRSGDAVPFLREAVRERKGLRSAVHELALCYKREGSFEELKDLLDDHTNLVSDSAFFLDFQIGLDISAGRFPEADSKIDKLRLLSDDNGRSGYREAQLLERRFQHRDAKQACTELLKAGNGVPPRIRCLRAVCSAHDKDFNLADEDIEFLSKLPAWGQAAERCRAIRFIAAGDLDFAKEVLDRIEDKTPEYWLLKARWLEAKAADPRTGAAAKEELSSEAQQLRLRNRFHIDYDFDD